MEKIIFFDGKKIAKAINQKWKAPDQVKKYFVDGHISPDNTKRFLDDLQADLLNQIAPTLSQIEQNRRSIPFNEVSVYQHKFKVQLERLVDHIEVQLIRKSFYREYVLKQFVTVFDSVIYGALSVIPKKKRPSIADYEPDSTNNPK